MPSHTKLWLNAIYVLKHTQSSTFKSASMSDHVVLKIILNKYLNVNIEMFKDHDTKDVTPTCYNQ